jgi:hypothetical protein
VAYSIAGVLTHHLNVFAFLKIKFLCGLKAKERLSEALHLGFVRCHETFMLEEHYSSGSHACALALL